MSVTPQFKNYDVSSGKYNIIYRSDGVVWQVNRCNKPWEAMNHAEVCGNNFIQGCLARMLELEERLLLAESGQTNDVY